MQRRWRLASQLPLTRRPSRNTAPPCQASIGGDHFPGQDGTRQYPLHKKRLGSPMTQRQSALGWDQHPPCARTHQIPPVHGYPKRGTPSWPWYKGMDHRSSSPLAELCGGLAGPELNPPSFQQPFLLCTKLPFSHRPIGPSGPCGTFGKAFGPWKTPEQQRHCEEETKKPTKKMDQEVHQDNREQDHQRGPEGLHPLTQKGHHHSREAGGGTRPGLVS